MNDTLLFILLFGIPLLLLWIAIGVDLIGRDDISIGKKAIWSVAVLLLAEIGAIAYLVSRPIRFPEEAGRQEEDPQVARLLEAAEAHRYEALSEEKMAGARQRALDDMAR